MTAAETMKKRSGRLVTGGGEISLHQIHMFCSSFRLISYYVISRLLFLLFFLVVGDFSIQLIIHKDVDY
jgi:hypothetical protein